MNPFNVIFIEDNKHHREFYLKIFSEKGCIVNNFCDVESLIEADKNNDICKNFRDEFETLVILNTTLVFTLDKRWDRAPKWDKDEQPSFTESLSYADNDLGFKVADKIRKGKFKHINKDTKILFFSSKDEEDILVKIEEIKRASFVVGPAFFYEVESLINTLLEKP
jgi:hypothetical protein